MADKIRKICCVSPSRTKLILICLKGKKVLLGNFWNSHRDGIHNRYLQAEAAFIRDNPELEEWERAQFQKDQNEYYKVLNKVDGNVEAAFSRKIGMRHVVDDAIITLEDARRVFDDSLF